MPPKSKKPLYLAHTLPGFEEIVALQLAQELDDVQIRKTLTIEQKNGLVCFEYPGSPEELLGLRTVEDIFLVVRHLTNLPPTRQALALLERAAAQATEIPFGLNVLRRLRPGKNLRGKLRFRVISRQAEQAAYRRIDAQRAVERGIAARADQKWRPDPQAGLEFWLSLLPGEAFLALRLSDARMRHREYKVEHLPASLRPSAAAALAFLTDPQPEDVFLDPMCGAGTILIERAHLARYKLLLGGDLHETALNVTRSNVGPRYKPIELRKWDARTLPLDAGSVTALAVNLPFGKQVGTTLENKTLYPAFLAEAVRVLQPGSRLVALTGDTRSLMAAASRIPTLEKHMEYRVRVLGQPATIHVFERR